MAVSGGGIEYGMCGWRDRIREVPEKRDRARKVREERQNPEEEEEKRACRCGRQDRARELRGGNTEIAIGRCGVETLG